VQGVIIDVGAWVLVKELQRVVKSDDTAQWVLCIDNARVCEVSVGCGWSGRKV
jgi:hypothetical protein